MNGLNLQASVSNLTQMDRHQQELHRAPMVNQEQNALIAQNEAAQRTAKPVQPDKVEDKKLIGNGIMTTKTAKKNGIKKTILQAANHRRADFY
jgi:hypothetical protein